MATPLSARGLGRLRTAVKWGATAVCVLTFWAVGASLRWDASCSVFAPRAPQDSMFRWPVHAVRLANGGLCVLHLPGAPLSASGSTREWQVNRAGGHVEWSPHLSVTGGQWAVILPLWIPLAFFTILASAAWLSAVRGWRRVGCHHCGYDLAGNTTGVCPECGERNGPGGAAA
jgi:hypothetical protein